MPILARLNQYACLLATEFNEIVTTSNTGVTGLGTYFANEFDENIGITSATANIYPPYDIIYDEFGAVLYGPGQGTYLKNYSNKTVVVYNEIDEVTSFT